MRTSIFLAAALAALAKADDASSTIIGYFSPPWDAGLPEYRAGSSTAASIAGINADATTYHVGCAKGAPKTDCHFPTSWTIVQGPETVSVTGKYIASSSGKSTSYDFTVTQSYECSLKSSTESASCTMSEGIKGTFNGGKYDVTSTSSATYTTAPITKSYYKLTVTGGLSSLTAPEATKTGAAAAGPAGAFITAGPMVAAAVAALL